MDIDIGQVGTRRHNLLSGLITESYDFLQHLFFFARTGMCHLYGMRQFVHRNRRLLMSEALADI